MKRLLVIIPVCFLFVAMCGGAAMAQERMSMLGTWSGPAQIATGDAFSTATMTLVIAEQEGVTFRGTMSFDEGTPFVVSGVFYGDKIRMTGSVSTFTGDLLFLGLTRIIVGSGSKLASENVGEMTVGFQLYWAGS